MTIRCRDCGLESEAEDLFFKTRPLFSHGEVKACCPPCHSKSQRLGCWNSLVACGFAAALGLGMVATGGQSGWFPLNACLVVLLAVPTIVVHEMSHAVTGRLVGVRILGITIGQGRRIFRRRILGTNIEWRLLPIAGFTMPGAAPAHLLRARVFLLILAGPLTHLLVVVALVCSARLWGLRLGSFTSQPAPLAALLISNGLMFIADLWPRQSFTDHGLVSNDIRLLLKIPFLPKKEVDDSLAAFYAREAMEADDRGETDQALQWAKMGVDASGGSQPALSAMGAVLCSMGAFREARTVFRRQLEHHDLPPSARLMYLNNIAFTDVMLHERQLLAEADEYSARACASVPWLTACMETRGAVLLELGRLEEGIALLQSAMDQNGNDPRARAFDACLLANAERVRGNPARAEEYVQTARRLDPKCLLLRQAGGIPFGTVTEPPE